RFLLHLLPKGFVRIRNFGFLANRRRAAFLPLCLHLLGTAQEPQADQNAACSNGLWRCPKCGGPMWSSKGSPLRKSNFAPHHGSLLPHETPLSNPNPSRLSACSVFLRLNTEQNSILNFLDPSSTILSCPSPFPAPSAVLYRTASATLHTAVSSHSISIGPASAANHTRLPSSRLIERARRYMPSFTALPTRAPEYALARA